MRSQRGEEDPRTMPTFGVTACWNGKWRTGRRREAGWGLGAEYAGLCLFTLR